MIIHTRIEGRHLGRGPFDLAVERDLYVYLPPGYDDSDRRYPVAYLLHAFGQDASSLVQPPLDRPRWRPPLEDVLDPVFARMGTAPMLVAVPDGSSHFGCGQWVDSPVSGNFEQYVLHDVVAHVDATFRTLAEAGSRGVLGFSSGGAGAWNIGSTRPDVFGALAMLSGDSYLDVTHKPLLYDYLTSIWPDAPDGPVEGNRTSDLVYALAAAYSPAPDRPPFHVDLPVAFPGGHLVEDVWARWLAFDPVVNWRTRLDSLARLRGILLDAGDADDHHLQWGHRILSGHLTTAGIGHRTTDNAGDHGGRSPERIQVALQWLAGVLDHDGP